MEEISKKDLLNIMGISYGQLYRWKRKGLIPEEWFIKKSSYTGQETYFPKELIIDRIDKILEYKDNVTLEDLSDIINNNINIKEIDIEKLINNNVFIHPDITKIVDKPFINFNELVLLKLLDDIYDNLKDIETLKKYYQFLKDKIKDVINDYKIMYCILKDENLASILVKDDDNVEYNLKDVLKIDINKILENLKLLVMI